MRISLEACLIANSAKFGEIAKKATKNMSLQIATFFDERERLILGATE